jgi:hypothetical protein
MEQGLTNSEPPAQSQPFAFVGWMKRHPELWVTVVLFVSSYFFMASFSKIANWTTHVDSQHVASFCRWDCNWYETVAEDGYDSSPHRHPRGDAANWAFFPLFPLSGRVFVRAFHPGWGVAVIIASRIEFFFAILAFLVWMRSELNGAKEYLLAGSLVAFNPYLIYAYAGYSEPLYFTLVCVGFILLQRHRWIASGLAGALLSATRFVGLMFAVSYLVVSIRDVGWRSVLRDRSLTVLIGLLLCPLGLVAFSLYLYHLTGDALAFTHIQVAWGRTLSNPIRLVVGSFYQYHWTRVCAVMMCVALGLSVWLMKVRPEYGIFLALTIVMPAASGSFDGMPRYIWWQPPFLYAVWILLRNRPFVWTAYYMFAGAIAAVMLLQWFTLNPFVT